MIGSMALMIAGASTSHVRPWIAAALSAVVVSAQSPAIAQPAALQPSAQRSDEERAAARAAATEGVQLLEAGRNAEALDRLRRAEALVHAPTHLLYIARAEVKLGLLVEASETYVKIVREALAADAPKAFVEAQAAAVQEGRELDARVPMLLIRVEGPGAAEATVSLDGTPLPPPMIGIAVPMNPGVHVLRAVGRDGASADARVKLVQGSRETAVLALRAMPGPVTAPVRTLDEPPPPAPSPDTGGGAGAGRWLGYAAVALGVAGVAVGTTFVVINRTKRTQANDLCPGDVCPLASQSQVQSLDQQADTAGAVAWVGYGVGGAAAATGIVLLLTSGRGTNKGASGGVHPWVGAGSCGVTGTF